MKRGATRDPQAGITAAVPALEQAIADCVGGWASQFQRVPTARELVHAFEVVLAASADELVEDPAATRATFIPSRPAHHIPLSLDTPATLSVKLGGWYGLDQIELVMSPPRSGRLSCVLEASGDTVLVDYWHTSAYPHPTEHEARGYLAHHAIAAWCAQRGVGPFARARFRAFDSLADPVDVTL